MIKSILLTTIQFLALGIILYTNPWFVQLPVLLAIQVIGLIIGIWAITEMSKSKLNIAPIIREGASLISTGPYRFVRHPMYLSLILFLFPILAVNFNALNGIVFLVLIINLLIKLFYEEKLLSDRFARYSDYKQKTWRLIPLIF